MWILLGEEKRICYHFIAISMNEQYPRFLSSLSLLSVVIICLCFNVCAELNYYVPPPPNKLSKIFAQTWPHFNGSAGGIIRRKSTRNESTCSKY